MVVDYRSAMSALRGFADHLLRTGLVRSVELRDHPETDSVDLIISTESGPRRYTLTGTEIMHGGEDALIHWCDNVERDLRVLQAGRRAAVASSIAPPPPPPHVARDWDRLFDPDEIALLFGLPRSDGSILNSRKSQERSAELFRLACGKEAFDTLEAGKPLPMTGSNGTAYTLHKKSSYCVTRVSDDALLCAVVPGVPLWDHLLGIKLMVEHDEPKFLKTANVAAGRDNEMMTMMAQLLQQDMTATAELQRVIELMNWLRQRWGGA